MTTVKDMRMANVPPIPDSDDEARADTRARPDHDLPPNTPRWVMVFGIIALALVVLVIVLHLTGGGFGSMMGHFGHQP
jgi:hypothetical protein